MGFEAIDTDVISDNADSARHFSYIQLYFLTQHKAENRGGQIIDSGIHRL